MKTIGFLLLLAATATAAEPTIRPDRPNPITFPAEEARFVRLLIRASSTEQPCIDELEVYGPDGDRNLALAEHGAKASASSCLSGYAIHRVEHLNDGEYGNSHSWIAAGTTREWAAIELPEKSSVARVVFSRDRKGQFADRTPVSVEVQLSADGRTWHRVAALTTPGHADTAALADAIEEGDLLKYAFLGERRMVRRIDDSDPTARVLRQTAEMLDRFAAKGLDVSKERRELAQLSRRYAALASDPAIAADLFFEARLAKRRLFFREPDLAAIRKILFVKRQPFLPSHNYSVIFDAQGAGGGAVCVLNMPWREGRLRPEEARVDRLFECGQGIARDPTADFAARKIYFGYRKTPADYFHILAMGTDGSHAEPLSDGPFHDYYPCPLPDGGLAFVSTRCKARFLCWRPQAFVLFRMDADGGSIRPLSHANISEWTPAVMRDGRILWMRSEYLDKGANFGHTLWAVRPDGSHPELLFGNNTMHCYANGREVPGTGEICCTLVSHGGDLNGPIALLDPRQGRSNAAAIRNITPDSPPHYHMDWARRECFRDPVPISRDYFLCSHAPEDRFGLYVIDRFGNRELLHLDPTIGSMCPTPLRPRPIPPVLQSEPAELPFVEEDEKPPAEKQMGRFLVSDVYRGLGSTVRRGDVKYLRVCEEVRSDLQELPGGEYRADHEPFQDWYATPIHKVSGPGGWPSYVAKSTLGLARVEEDGSAHFYAPSGKVLYFEALDENFNELQRMRSVVQLQPGEVRSCVGCHEDRMSAPPRQPAIAMRREGQQLQPPPWGAGPFSYARVVQPVWNAKCVACHDKGDEQGIDLRGVLDADRVPASYRTLIASGWVDFFDCRYTVEHKKADARSFGTLQSRLWKVLDRGHHDVKLSEEEQRRIKCWIDLNCPLWPDYQFRPDRAEVARGGL